MKKEKLIICRTAWMEGYNGITDGDIPFNYVDDTYSTSENYAGEIYNFQEFNDKCYGYIQGYGNTHIETYFKTYFEDKSVVSGFTIVWCAFDHEGELRIIGWYKSASIYRNHRYIVDFFPQDSDDNGYDCSVDCDNVFLISKTQRDFKLNDYLSEAQLKHIKTNPILSYEDAGEKLIEDIKQYIDCYKGEFLTSGIMKNHLKEYPKEKLTYEEAYEKGLEELRFNYTKALQYFNAARMQKETSKVMFYTAKCLQELNCFGKAIEFYAKALELDRKSTEPLVNILICYAKSGDVSNTLNIAKKVIKLLKSDKTFQKSEWLVDSYFILSNVYVYMNQFNDARNTIKKVLDVRNEAYDKVFVQDVLDIIEDVEEDYFYKM